MPVVRYTKSRKSIGRLLQANRIGAIGHISCIDRMQRAPGSSNDDDPLNDLTADAASQLAEICNLLGHTPVSVTARARNNDRATCLQVFLQLDEQIGIHYFATIDDDPGEHQLWIEGSNGSLRTNGNSVWWRKRGWPKFIPARIGIFGARSKASVPGEQNDELAQAIASSASHRETVRMAPT